MNNYSHMQDDDKEELEFSKDAQISEPLEELKYLMRKLRTLGGVGIKISFEEEGAQLNEIITMRYLTASQGFSLSVKIGGCEAKRDIIDSINLSADVIVAPMIESSFSLEKFIGAINTTGYKNRKGFNLETIQGFLNLQEIISSSLGNIDFITFGRGDFASSLGYDKQFINSIECYNYVSSVFTKAKLIGLTCNLGGVISMDSHDFISRLYHAGLLDVFETRYVIISMQDANIHDFKDILYYSTMFEIKWIEYVSNRYNKYSQKNTERINIIQERMHTIKNNYTEYNI